MIIKSPKTPPDGSPILNFTMGVENLYDINNNLVFIPPITMHIAPNNLNFQYKKIITRQRTRGGWLEQYWGEELDVVTAAASTGSFQILDTGLITSQRFQSIANINFQEIFDLYKNNACTYDSAGDIITQGDVYLDYDNWHMDGQFATFNWTEVAELPFRWDFNFTFEITKLSITL
jgi:hypothetical protein